MQCKITLFAVRCPALLLQILRWPLRMTGKAPCSRFLALLGMTVCWLLGMTVCWLLGMTVITAGRFWLVSSVYPDWIIN